MHSVNVTFCNSICSNADKIKDIFGLSSLKMLAKLLKSAQMYPRNAVQDVIIKYL